MWLEPPTASATPQVWSSNPMAAFFFLQNWIAETMVPLLYVWGYEREEQLVLLVVKLETVDIVCGWSLQQHRLLHEFGHLTQWLLSSFCRIGLRRRWCPCFYVLRYETDEQLVLLVVKLETIDIVCGWSLQQHRLLHEFGHLTQWLLSSLCRIGLRRRWCPCFMYGAMKERNSSFCWL
jgi:ABC-type uncharacterized transport system permease subunit